MHHVITDGWSISILFREVTKCYAAFTRNETPDLPELSVQYAEYAQWQREYMSGDVLKNEIEHWKNKLAGAQTLLDLPTDHPRPSTHSWHGSTEEICLDKTFLAKLKAIAQAENSTSVHGDDGRVSRTALALYESGKHSGGNAGGGAKRNRN